MNNFTKENFLNYIKFSEKLISKRSAERKAGYKETEKYYADTYDAVVLEKKTYYWNGYAALFGCYKSKDPSFVGIFNTSPPIMRLIKP